MVGTNAPYLLDNNPKRELCIITSILVGPYIKKSGSQVSKSTEGFNRKQVGNHKYLLKLLSSSVHFQMTHWLIMWLINY